MLHKIKGIVLNYIRYKETSIIVKIFTNDFGLQSYIVNGVRSNRGAGKIALFQPMTILDLVVYKNDQKSIQRISESRCDIIYHSIPFDIKKSSVAIFWSEILNKTLTSEGLEDSRKFEFVREQLIKLDEATDGIENYPITFTYQLAEFLGFAISCSRDLVRTYSDVINSTQEELIKYFESIFTAVPLENNISQRQLALNCLINYYQHHFDGFGSLRSTGVLRQVFS
ncbi:MAG: DNA repair protein RecO [Bacteroidetes bacterium]|nr:DNA repair protein RecO [Bacteroidota bacterium]MDA1119252.1 DNA repair protein RecO [Bacteroidota bacterium]